MKPLLIVLALGRMADMSTSLVGFQAGAYEANPLVVSSRPVPFVSQVMLETAGETWMLSRLAEHHPKWAKGLALIQIGASATVSVMNARTIAQQHRMARTR